jgi:hypothetical protein
MRTVTTAGIRRPVLIRRLTPASSCTADKVQSQGTAASSAEPGPPSWQAGSRVSFNAWLAAVDTIRPIVGVSVMVHDSDDNHRRVLARIQEAKRETTHYSPANRPTQNRCSLRELEDGRDGLLDRIQEFFSNARRARPVVAE